MFATQKYSATKDQTDFSFSFPYLDAGTVKVFKNGVIVDSMAYTLHNGVVSFFDPMLGGEQITIKRVTSITSRSVDFTDVSILRETDLDTAFIQLFYKIQEQQDEIEELRGV